MKSPGVTVPIREWTNGVEIEVSARKQLEDTAKLPFVWPHLAVMPDVHWGNGSTVGSVVPTRGAIVPACVGVDLGCGMCAVKTPLTSTALGDNAQRIFDDLSRAIPHGRTDDGGLNDRGAWGSDPPFDVQQAWSAIRDSYDRDVGLDRPRERAPRQLGTLGTGNHFVEVCLDEADAVWIMLHSGSRGVGNAIGSYFIAAAKRRCEADGVVLPNADLAWLPEGAPEFDTYVRAVGWAQNYARCNREVMLLRAIEVLRQLAPTLDWSWLPDRAVNCHHNYVQKEKHFGEDLWITRKGAVSARFGELGIIPGSMGKKSFIVRGKGNAESFHTCSHGAGRLMSRGQARKMITLEQHVRDTEGIVCRKDEGVLDESPRAYKDIDTVMAAQVDLVDVVHTLRAVVCVKG
jgi:tRNA-splicing ligase RtcB (3'-phosphate/5'-hydroxy nucleic acid ligase)